MYIFYPIIITLGFFTSYTDTKSGKIKNRHLLFALVSGLAIYAYLTLSQNPILGPGLAWNFFISLGIGLTLYFTDTWSAGDAKLFMVFCLLMPTEKYSHIIPSASIVVFVNIFLLSTIVMLFSSINHILKTKTQIFKQIFSASVLERLVISFLIMISFSWIVPILMQALIPKITVFLHVMLMYFAYHALYAFIIHGVPDRRIGFMLFGLGFLIRLYFHPLDFLGISILTTLKKTIIYSFSFSCLYIILEKNKPTNEKHAPFAPIIFLGTLLANTNFLDSIMKVLMILRK